MLGIVYNDIAVDHSLEFGIPQPTDQWDRNIKPAFQQQGVYNFQLSRFPKNDLPSGGMSDRISPSEMAMIFLEFRNYPFRNAKIWIKWKIYEAQRDKLIFEYSSPVLRPKNGWNIWSMFLYSFIGHFGWEISKPGLYYIMAITPWGKARINFQVGE